MERQGTCSGGTTSVTRLPVCGKLNPADREWGCPAILRLLVPAEFRPSIHAVDFQALRARGIRGLIVDLDNTLVEWRSPSPTPDVHDWIRRARAAGLDVCIVSNGGSRRVEGFARRAGVGFVGAAGKPRRRGFLEALDRLGTLPSETAVVGDQLFTDILGGNRLGMYTILVAPVSSREFAGTRLVRKLERLVLRRLARAGQAPLWFAGRNPGPGTGT